MGLSTCPLLTIIPNHGRILIGQGPLISWSLWILTLFLIGVIFNGFLDYLSLWETRIILRSSLPTLVKVLVDLLCTTIIVRILFGVALMFVLGAGLRAIVPVYQAGTMEGAADVLLLFVMYATQFIFFPPHFGGLAFVIFITSFSTSFWLILHILSGLIIRFAPITVSKLNISEKPVRALGVIAIVLVWLIGLTVGAFAIPYHATSSGETKAPVHKVELKR
nr:hypothetical protein [uncultured Desulfuromonas sp.]